MLYSDIPPLRIKNSQETIYNKILEEVKNSDEIKIAVGYASKASLKELENIIDANDLKVELILGMYYLEGMPESIYFQALELNKKWEKEGRGNVLLIKPFKFHGKLYCFYKNGNPFSAVNGSANLSVLKPDSSSRRIYECAEFIDKSNEYSEISEFFKELRNPKISENISLIKDITLLTETNNFLDGHDLVETMPSKTVDIYKKHLTGIRIDLPLKVPSYAERLTDDKKHYTKSNLNVCYATPRSSRKARSWFETQLTVSKKTTQLPGYPKLNQPFFIVTDDGFWFKAHTTSSGNKQFSAVGDELIMGRWLKGRLAAAGLIEPVFDTLLDITREGAVTKEILNDYGRNSLAFVKTDQKAQDNSGKLLDVWYLSFEKG